MESMKINTDVKLNLYLAFEVTMEDMMLLSRSTW